MVFVPGSKTDLQTAVNIWINDNATALSTYGDINTWDTSQITDMSQLFDGKTTFNSDISNWNTGNVTNMSYMLRWCSEFKQNIGGWDTAKVTNMNSMFQGATAFNQDIGSWNTADVTNMSNMFQGARAFNQNIGGWNTGNVTNMNHMFGEAFIFNQNIGMWNTANVTNMTSMFQSAMAFNQDIGSWNTANVTNMTSMFQGATAFNQDIGGWNTTNVGHMLSMFQGAAAFNQNIGGWNTARNSTMRRMFYGATAFNGDISNWDTSNVNNMYFMFNFATSFNQNIGGWDTSKVTTMEAMFQGNTIFNQNIRWWNVSESTILKDMFSGATAMNTPYSSTPGFGYPTPQLSFFNQIYQPLNKTDLQTAVDLWVSDKSSAISTYGVINRWDTSQITDMSDLFKNKLTFNSDIRRWNTSNVTNMDGMFDGAIAFDYDIRGWVVGETTTMNDMFNNASTLLLKYSNLFGDDVSITPTANFFDVGYQFNSNAELRKAVAMWFEKNASAIDMYGDIVTWGTAYVTDMSELFASKSTFDSDISNWDTSNVTNMRDMFNMALIFNQNIGGWDTSKVTDMSRMFNHARKFSQPIGGWNTAKVTDMSLMFNFAIVFDEDIRGWNTAKVTTMYRMFSDAKAFNRNIRRWIVGESTILSEMFSGATAMNSVYNGTDGYGGTPLISFFNELSDETKNEITNAVPVGGIEIADVMPVSTNGVDLTSGSAIEKSEKRSLFLKTVFEKNSGLAEASGKITMSKAELLGSDSTITKSTMVIKKATNTETPLETSNLGGDEAMYVYMGLNDYTIISTSAGNLKVEKISLTTYNIYENYENGGSVTDTMSVGESSTYGGILYVLGNLTVENVPSGGGSGSVAPICFPAGTKVVTNHGEVSIEKLNPDIHTIRNKRIVAITESRPLFTHIVSIEKDALGKNVPSVRTEISKEHNVFYKGKMRTAMCLVELCKGVVEIAYNGEPLYNVLLEKHGHMMINNLVCETLHPENIMAKICGGKYNSREQEKICEELNKIIKANNYQAYKKLYQSLK